MYTPINEDKTEKHLRHIKYIILFGLITHILLFSSVIILLGLGGFRWIELVHRYASNFTSSLPPLLNDARIMADSFSGMEQCIEKSGMCGHHFF